MKGSDFFPEAFSPYEQRALERAIVASGSQCRLCKRSVESPLQSMWPYPTYKPISWDKYYVADPNGGKSTITSGLAAGITIGVFFTVFLLTFGCRIYSARMERLERRNSERVANSAINAEDFAADLWICGVPREPPPPYEIAIHMPRCASSLPTPPPPTPSLAPSTPFTIVS
uniref:Uncharacterized protein n=1 Tax=Ascaris lumbricoides TaxID=6252 RepID=A0A0M3IP03_ASCLU